MRSRLRRLEARSREDLLVVPQRDGPPARFPQRAAAEAYLTAFAHATGQDAPDHPLCAAARNSSDAWWRGSVYAAEPAPRETPDLSE